jgi:hypothetical protein
VGDPVGDAIHEAGQAFSSKAGFTDWAKTAAVQRKPRKTMLLRIPDFIITNSF